MRELKDYKKSVIAIAKDQRDFVTILINILRDTDLNSREKRHEFAKGLEEGRLRSIEHFIEEEIRLQKEEKE